MAMERERETQRIGFEFIGCPPSRVDFSKVPLDGCWVSTIRLWYMHGDRAGVSQVPVLEYSPPIQLRSMVSDHPAFAEREPRISLTWDMRLHQQISAVSVQLWAPQRCNMV